MFINNDDNDVTDINDDIKLLINKYKSNKIRASGYDNLNDDEYKLCDPYEELIKTKNNTIEELKLEIATLKQKLIDQSLLYNEKIELLKTQHKMELLVQHKQYMKKLKLYHATQNTQSQNMLDSISIGLKHNDLSELSDIKSVKSDLVELISDIKDDIISNDIRSKLNSVDTDDVKSRLR